MATPTDSFASKSNGKGKIEKQHAKLQGVYEHGQYWKIPGHPHMGNQDQTAHYPNMQGLPNTFPTNYRSDAVGSTRQQYVPYGNTVHENFNQWDQESVANSGHPPYDTAATAHPGATFKQPSHFAGKNPRESPDLYQMDQQSPYYRDPQTPYYTKQGPSGIPPPTIPPVDPYEDDINESSIHRSQLLGSFPSQLQSVSEVIEAKFLKLEGKDVCNFDSTHNITVFGGEGVGKSEIMKYFSGANQQLNIKILDQKFKSTGITIYLKNKETRKIIRLKIYEASKYDVSHVKVERYKQSEVAVVVFDVSSNESLREANHWIKKIKEHTEKDSIEFILVGNKSDLSSAFTTKGLDFASRMKMSYTVTCAINGLGLDVLLENVATLAYEQSIKTDKNESRFKALEESQKMFLDIIKSSQESMKTMQHEQKVERQRRIKLQEQLDEQDARRREDEAKLQEQEHKLKKQQQMLEEQRGMLEEQRQQHQQPQQQPPQQQGQPQAQKKKWCTIM